MPKVPEVRSAPRMNWRLVRAGLLIAALATTFNLGRSSIEFNGTGSAWAMLVLGTIALVGCLIGLAAGELVRDRPRED
jgi:hypothetical protein